MKSDRNHRAWIAECGLGYLVLFAVNLLFFAGEPAFRETRPHPYLFLVLLLSARYGLVAGIVSAAAGSMLLFGWGGAEIQLGVWEPLSQSLFQSLLFLSCGLVLGLVAEKRLNRISQLEEELDDLEEPWNAMQQENETLRNVAHELEARVLTEVQSFARLHRIGQNLEQLEKDTICQRVPLVLAESFQASRCAIYLFENEALHLKAAYGYEKGEAPRDIIPLDDSMIGRACTTRKALSIRDVLDTPGSLDYLGETIACAPLLDTSRHLIGAMNIGKMPFLRVTRPTMTLLNMVAHWTAKALSNAAQFESVQAHVIEDHLLEVYNRRYFDQRLLEEFTRSQTYALPFCVALVGVETDPSLSARFRLDEVKWVVSYLQLSLRPIDILTRYSEEVPLAILMTTTGRTEAESILGKMEEDLNGLLGEEGPQTRVRLGLSAFREGMESAEEILKEAEANLCVT